QLRHPDFSRREHLIQVEQLQFRRRQLPEDGRKHRGLQSQNWHFKSRSDEGETVGFHVQFVVDFEHFRPFAKVERSELHVKHLHEIRANH
ncbi:hypothetical protein PENTCL1PPCAC_1179, partial [Pristionchus entomophagus]